MDHRRCNHPPRPDTTITTSRCCAAGIDAIERDADILTEGKTEHHGAYIAARFADCLTLSQCSLQVCSFFPLYEMQRAADTRNVHQLLILRLWLSRRGRTRLGVLVRAVYDSIVSDSFHGTLVYVATARAAKCSACLRKRMEVSIG
jgi:hypothetical protein